MAGSRKEMEFREDFKVHPDHVIIGDPVHNDICIIVQKGTWKGREKVHVRGLYRDDNTQKWCPGKGAAFSPDFAADVIHALCKQVGIESWEELMGQSALAEKT